MVKENILSALFDLNIEILPNNIMYKYFQNKNQNIMDINEEFMVKTWHSLFLSKEELLKFYISTQICLLKISKTEI